MKLAVIETLADVTVVRPITSSRGKPSEFVAWDLPKRLAGLGTCSIDGLSSPIIPGMADSAALVRHAGYKAR